MTNRDGIMLPPEGGRLIAGGGMHATLKVAGQAGTNGGDGALTSTFEVQVPGGYDVGAHVHSRGEELFFVLEGELDMLAFEPVERSGDWHEWTSADGRRYLRGGPGSLLFVPAGCPHAFGNPGTEPTRMLFQSAPGGHEDYFIELTALLQATGGHPDQDAVTEIRNRHDIHQLTALRGRS